MLFGASLSPLQLRVLRALAPMRPPWTLIGGAALVGYHDAYRTTRDLDLVWHSVETLGTLSEAATRLLR